MVCQSRHARRARASSRHVKRARAAERNLARAAERNSARAAERKLASKYLQFSSRVIVCWNSMRVTSRNATALSGLSSRKSARASYTLAVMAPCRAPVMGEIR